MIYEIVTYGDPVLRERSVPIENIDSDILELASNMMETLRARNGLGLAAQQIGKTVSLCVVDLPERCDKDSKTGERQNPEVITPLVMANPRIVESSGEQTDEEGCLSFPDIFVAVKRQQNVTVTFTGLDGKEQTIAATALLARVIQHELDHLNGVLLVDRMSAIKRVSLSGKLKGLRKRHR